MTNDTAVLTATAPAKVNLTLHVTGQRPDGYHLLDSLVVFSEQGDRLTLTPGAQMLISVSGPFAQGVPTDRSNLVWRAAELASWTGAVHLEKNLPHAAGIGSGSSDAAGVLRLLADAGHKIPPEDVQMLGADVPVCVAGRAARMRGIGEDVERVALPELPALLINPGVPVPTGGVFAGMARRDNPAMPEAIPEFKAVDDCAAWLGWLRNDLEPPALELAPDIEIALRELRATRDVLLARMSGSGATCFALYPDMKAAHFAAYEIGAAHPDWWCLATMLS